MALTLSQCGARIISSPGAGRRGSRGSGGGSGSGRGRPGSPRGRCALRGAPSGDRSRRGAPRRLPRPLHGCPSRRGLCCAPRKPGETSMSSSRTIALPRSATTAETPSTTLRARPQLRSRSTMRCDLKPQSRPKTESVKIYYATM